MRNSANQPLLAMERHHPAGEALPVHQHAEGQLCIAIAGTATLTTPAGRWLAPPGRGVWIPAHEAHGAEYSQTATIMQVLVPLGDCAGFPPQTTLVEVRPLLRELALEIARLEPDDPTITPLLTLIRREVGQSAAGPILYVPFGQDPRLQTAMRCLIEDPACTLDLPHLAAQCVTSARTLARLFEAEAGMSFIRWREHLRINLAIERLARGQAITQIAFDLGYQSSASFTAMFSRITGSPPARMQRQLRAP